jgi:hypothetical protein
LNTDLVLLVIIPEIRRRRCSPTVAWALSTSESSSSLFD